MDWNPPITSELVFPDRSAQMTDSSEKCNCLFGERLHVFESYKFIFSRND